MAFGVVPIVRSLIFALFALLAGCAAADRFDDFIKSKMDEEKILGLQFVVTYKGKTVMSRAYGFSDPDQKTPIAKDTPFEIASTSKPIIATAVMMLYEQGKVRLEEPVGKYVSGIPLAWSRVPIRNLLSHTSGVPEFRGGELYAKHRMEDTPLAEITKTMSGELSFDPGDHFAYSNTNYLLLGKLIEAVTGKPFTDYLQTQIFEPCGMKSSGFIGKAPHVQGYAATSTGHFPVRDCSLTWAGPGASIVSTAEDLGRFDAALAQQKLVKNATMNQMLQPTVTRLGTMDYGLGWQIAQLANNLMAVHQGEMNGFSSVFLRLPTQQISVIVLCNASAMDANTFSRGILGLYFPELDPTQLTPIVDAEPETTRAHLHLLQTIAAGDPDMDAFSDEYKAHISIEKLRAMGAELARGGSIKPLQVLRRYKKGDFDAHVYLMTQGRTQIVVTIFVDQQGKVGGLTVAAP